MNAEFLGVSSCPKHGQLKTPSLLAHSKGENRPRQLYRDHIKGVVTKVRENLANMRKFIPEERYATLESTLIPAANFHDLGKLDAKNQAVLNDELSGKPLPIEHRDAGTSYLLGQLNKHAAALVFAHHRPGLPDFSNEQCKKNAFRFDRAIEYTDRYLETYLSLHEQELGKQGDNKPSDAGKLSAMTYRMLLSCLVDADYTSTSGTEIASTKPRWSERAEKLDAYVAGLKGIVSDDHDASAERMSLRQDMYDHSKTAQIPERIVYCDAPVGSGKTTAVMAYLLNVAERLALRHIIVVVPFVNIISQTVSVYREALVLEGEEKNDIVAELHHGADYSSFKVRHLASTWSEPIIVTTAVQFFESLASNSPSKLRKIHQLPGSAILIDESHASLPVGLMPLAWTWIQELTENWGCYACLCSGTTVKYWATDSMGKIATQPVAPLLSPKLSKKLEVFENNRVKCNFVTSKPPHFKSMARLADFIVSKSGPRLVVMNTVMSAAALASYMRDAGTDVLHLSTALTPKDREKVLKTVVSRLENSNEDKDWTLVATSCVECGLDLSFTTGFCEMRSLQSAWQLSGRIGRNGDDVNAALYCFTVSDSIFTRNSTFEIAIKTFEELIDSRTIENSTISESVTLSFDIECKRNGGLHDTLRKSERRCNFAKVAEEFRVIDDDTVTLLADAELIKAFEAGVKISSREHMLGSVSIERRLLKKLKTVKLSEDGELYTLREGQYNDFIGYTEGLLSSREKSNMNQR